MIIALIILLVLGFVISILGYYYGADISFSPIIGFMVGSLYAFNDFDEGREHTIQVCLIFLSITVEWVETSNG